MEKRIKITDEDVKLYKEYVDIQDGFAEINFKNILKLIIAMIGFIAVGSICIMASLAVLISKPTIIGCVIFSVSLLSFFPIANIFSKMIEKSELNKFKMKHPDFDMSLDNEEVKQALAKYEVEKKQQIGKQEGCQNKKEELELNNGLLEEVKKLEQTDEVQNYYKLLSIVEQTSQNEERQEEQVLVKSKIDDVKRRC